MKLFLLALVLLFSHPTLASYIQSSSSGGGGGAVDSVNGLDGDVILTTSEIAEGSNLYHTTARVIASALTGFSAGAGTVTSSDTILQAMNKIVGNIALKANLASPTFTGTVTLPSGSISSSAWDTGSSTFTSNGVAFTAKAPLASPTFTGTVTLPSGSVSTTAWDTGTSTFTSNGVAFTAKAPLANPAFTGSVTFGNYHLEPCETDDGNSGTADTLDLSTCAARKSTLTGNVTYTLSNPVTGGSYVIRILTGAGSFTVTWPATVKWAGGVAPVITTTASRMDLVNLYWDGTNYYGSFTQNYTP